MTNTMLLSIILCEWQFGLTTRQIADIAELNFFAVTLLLFEMKDRGEVELIKINCPSTGEVFEIWKRTY